MKAVLAAVCLIVGVVGTVLACGGSQTSTHDGTSVTLEKPADSAAPSPSASTK